MTGTVAGVQAGRPVGRKHLGRFGRLDVHRIKGDIGLTLETIYNVPLGATMAPENDSRRRHRRSSTRSSISGQSRHNLSNA